MEITIKGSVREIAAFTAELLGRRENIENEPAVQSKDVRSADESMDIEAHTSAVRGVLQWDQETIDAIEREQAKVQLENNPTPIFIHNACESLRLL